MIAGAVDGQIAFEFFVAIFTLAAGGVVVVGCLGQHAGTRTIADDKPAVSALGMGLGFDDDPAWPVPRAGLIPKALAEPLGFLGNGGLGLRLFEQGFAVLFENVVAADAEGVVHAEAFADVVHPRHAIAAVAADVDVHVGPDLAKAAHQMLEVVVGP